MCFTPLQPARLDYDATGRPYSERYGDIYQPKQPHILNQARTVFLAGNGLPARWQARDSFVVCETGFGLGVNFLALWHAWRNDAQRCKRLHVVSVEAHPLSDHDLAQAHAALPDEVASLAAQLRQQWPSLLPGLHRLEFENGALTLTLGLGQAADLVPRLCLKADAFFLDGFAPTRNPAMWQPELIAALARLAAPGATAATWCSAGAVRRALQSAGFAVDRIAGSDGKRHVTRAMYQRTGQHDGAPWLTNGPQKNRHALIVGAGLAGAGIAQSLVLRGWHVEVIDPALAKSPAGTHVGHLAAALSPIIARDDNPRARLSRAGSARALARWLNLPGTAAPRRTGTLQLSRDAGRAAAARHTLATLAFPSAWVRWLERDEARTLSGLPLQRGGLYFRDGLLVRPDALLTALLALPGISVHPQRVLQLQHKAAGWQAWGENGALIAQAPTVILANAAAAPTLLPPHSLAALPKLQALHALAGEISLLPASTLGDGPRCIVGGEGYLLPPVEGWCVAGSTYVHGAHRAQISDDGRHVNLRKAAGLSGLAFNPAHAGPGWAGWRAVMPGRLPVIGPVPDASGLWLATGYASRGLSWSALAGDLLAAALENEPLPLERDLLATIAPR